MKSAEQSPEDILGESFAQLMERRAPEWELVEWLSPPDPRTKQCAEDWKARILPALCAVGDFDWLPLSDQRWVRRCVLDFALKAFTELWKPFQYSSGTFRKELSGFVNWLGSLSDSELVPFCWDLLAYKRDDTPEPVWWLKRSGRLSGAISYNNLCLAVSLRDEADAMYWWPDERWVVANWARDSAPYIELLSHKSYLVRAAAGKALGVFFNGTRFKGKVANDPSPAEVLSLVQASEIETPGIAGPFLNGTECWCDADVWQALNADIDMKNWFLETLEKSRIETRVPHIQTLEFFAHELFCRDANAIRQFLKMDRIKLAVMTATDEPEAIDELLPLLHEMAASDNPGVSAAIREYLSVREHHAGLDHVSDSD